MPRYFSLFLFLFLALSTLRAQDEPLPSPSPNETYAGQQIQRHDFDEKKWASLKEGIDYSGPKKPAKKASKKKVEKEMDLPSSGIKGLGPILKILAIILLVGALVLLIVKMAGGENLFGPRNSKIKPAVSQAEIDQIEENLHEAELDDPIQRAIAARDFPMAVRLYYLAVLKELALKNHIRWKRDKTNGEYLREMAGSPLFGTVQEVTLAFERVWYGKVELTRPDFDQLEIKLKKAVATASA
ncbi:MAG: DUF4129 domain-containing protein [Saprospiraceae bacterium]|nr:DUF4129 domain-containing protein [Saprospiraceae bacterium]MCF8251465.1 DUF4129 domain-containing protein [Saprospiraceae bacterium]MCF8282225.1 DUF4129 domain-containing protein [Bacteroidales bacterium]MCF8313059.1 DUF4129 domain-containing protein [Saprospiraceae bacterium]MCF8441507.1 DUF4129 domain-containing protein [Saprospiraceae bacterium]